MIARAVVNFPNIMESEGWDVVDASRMAPHIPFPFTLNAPSKHFSVRRLIQASDMSDGGSSVVAAFEWEFGDSFHPQSGEWERR